MLKYKYHERDLMEYLAEGNSVWENIFSVNRMIHLMFKHNCADILAEKR